MTDVLLPTSLVGSYAQPDWLIDRNKLAGRFPPRVRARELWRVTPEFLEQAQDDATLLAIRDQERAGLDIITDGEQRRESYSNRFATALEGVDIDNPGTALDRSGHPNPVPRVVGKIRRKQPVQVRRHYSRAAVGLFIPAGIGCVASTADFDRDSAVQSRLLYSGKATGQDDHTRHTRPVGHGDRDPGNGRSAYPPCAATRAGRTYCGGTRLWAEIPAPRHRLWQDASDG